MSDNEGELVDEIRTAAGLSVRDLKGTKLSELATFTWFLSFNAQLARHQSPLQSLLDIANGIGGDRAMAAAVPLSGNRFKQFFSRMGRAMTDDGERITQNAVSGTILAILWDLLSHYAYNIGLTPKKLDFGPRRSGHALTRVLWAARNAQFHSTGWMFRDFASEGRGIEEIRVLGAVGIQPIPFSAYRALQVLVPHGSISSITMPLLEVAREMMISAEPALNPKRPRARKKTKAVRKTQRRTPSSTVRKRDS